MEKQSQSLIMKFLSPLTYPQKFIFISCLFGFSILVASYFMIKAQNYNINFAKKELQGLNYVKPLRKLLEDIPQYYLAAIPSQDSDDSHKFPSLSLQSKVNTDFKNLIAVDQQHETDLSTAFLDLRVRDLTSIKPTELEKKWQELIHQPAGSDQAAELYQSLTNDLKRLMNYVGDTSNLMTDPATDTFYIVQNLLVNVPSALELIPNITMKSQIGSKQNDKTHDEIIGMLALLRNYLTAAKESIEKVYSFEKILNDDVETQNRIKGPFQDYVNNVEAFIRTVESPTDSHKDLNAVAKNAIDAGFTFWDSAEEQLARLLNARLQSFIVKQRISALITLLGALAGFVVGFLMMREISRPLTNLINAAKNLSSGNLTARVPITYKDEVGEVGNAFNQMAQSFQDLIGKLQWTGIQLTTSTTEIASTAKQQESTMIEQEATTKEIAATAREISATAKDFAKTMNDVSSRAEQTSALASSGKQGLTQMESIMRQMVDAAGNIASKLAVMNEKAGSVTSIITTISKVADQTNLLSLNAAIEAEKAGEYGRSFAVIAREIRRLADQTANATLDIEKMVNEMVSAVSAGVMGVDKFSEEINTGVKQVTVVGEQLSKIIEQVQGQTNSFEAVNQGMQAQSVGAEQINESINQLSEAAQQTTESIRQFHNAIEQLNNAAQEMQTAVSKSNARSILSDISPETLECEWLAKKRTKRTKTTKRT